MAIASQILLAKDGSLDTLADTSPRLLRPLYTYIGMGIYLWTSSAGTTCTLTQELHLTAYPIEREDQ